MRPPDITGNAGEAWELKSDGATIAHWAVQAPDQSPFWDRYIVAALDLSPKWNLILGNVSLDFPDARWEIACWALDPEPERPEWPDNPNTATGPLAVLIPQNVRVQLPDHPAELVSDATRAIVAAALAPMWGMRLEPLFTDDQNRIWDAVLEATLQHPYHHGDRS